MMQPTLISYTFDTPPHSVPPNSVSIKPSVIPLLDTFLIFIFNGRTVTQRRKAGHQDQEGFENSKELLKMPVCGAQVTYLLSQLSCMH